jgi:hypothetical protein
MPQVWRIRSEWDIGDRNLYSSKEKARKAAHDNLNLLMVAEEYGCTIEAFENDHLVYYEPQNLIFDQDDDWDSL